MLEQAARSGDDGARIELGNRLLSEHRYGSADHEAGLELLKQAARGPRGVHAQWFLGAYSPKCRCDRMRRRRRQPVKIGEKWLWRTTLREHCLHRAANPAAPS